MKIKALFLLGYLLSNEVIGCLGVKTITDQEIKDLSKKLINMDENSFPMNLDFCNGKKSEKLFSKGCPDFNSKPTFKSMLKLFNNYDPDVNHDEIDTADEKQEIEEFLDEILKTKVVKEFEKFLKEKSLISNDKDALRKQLKQIWFCEYSRSKNHKSSTGFEHEEIGEFKNRQVSGGHGWPNFCLKEHNKGIDQIKVLNASKCYGDQRVIGGLRYTWQNYTKPISSMFIGLSPECEMSIYSLCLLTRENKGCKVTVKDDIITITAFSMDCENGKALGSAFPRL